MLSNSQTNEASTIHGDRRSYRRYELELDLSYVVHTGSRITLAGSGKSCNVSSGGLLFRAGGIIEVNSTVIAAMRWPLATLEGEPLLLVVSGRVAWSTADCTALALTRHEFIPESQYQPNDLRSVLPLRMIPTRSGARRGHSKAKPGRPIILIVDTDDRQGVLAKLLESYGYAVQYAERNRATEVLASGSLDISLLITSSMVGFERFATSVPVILTAAENAVTGNEAGLARRVVRKPLVLREILSAVQELGGPPKAKSAVAPIRT